MQPNKIQCEASEELISASLDEELTIEERLQLEDHLATCATCREMESRLTGVNRLLQQSRSDMSVSSGLGLLGRSGAPAVNASAVGTANWRSNWIGVAAAAAIILLVTAATLIRSPEVAANPMLGPLTEARQISAQQRNVQETVLQTMEWELRTLKLQLAELEADPAIEQKLTNRLQRLLDRVDRAKQLPTPEDTR